MFYEKLISLCDTNGVKLTPLLKELDVSTGNISNWKRGLDNVSSETLKKIAKYFNVSVDWLLELTEVTNGLYSGTSPTGIPKPKSDIEILFEALNKEQQAAALGFIRGLLAAEGIDANKLLSDAL